MLFILFLLTSIITSSSLSSLYSYLFALLSGKFLSLIYKETDIDEKYDEFIRLKALYNLRSEVVHRGVDYIHSESIAFAELIAINIVHTILDVIEEIRSEEELRKFITKKILKGGLKSNKDNEAALDIGRDDKP